METVTINQQEKSKNVNHLLEVLNIFKEKFGDQFVVGGSLALYKHGFDCNPRDIDLEFQTKDYAKISELVALNWAYTLKGSNDASRYPDKENHYRFEIKGVMIDVWVVDKIDYASYVYSDYIKYADVISVLKKKIAMKRPKDYIGVANIVAQVNSLIR